MGKGSAPDALFQMETVSACAGPTSPTIYPYGRSRLSWKRNRGVVQFLYSRFGATASRPSIDGPSPILFGRDTLVLPAGMDYPPLVDSGRRAF